MTWAEGPALGFDLETTGPDPTTALPVSFALVWFNGGEITKRRYGLVDPGIEIPAETVAIHGITTEMVRERGGSLEKSVIGIAGEILAAGFAETPVIGCNLVYDLTVIDTCLRSFADGEGLTEIGWQGHAVDCLVLDRHVDRYRKGPRKLTDLCVQYGIALSDAHHAGADAEAAARVSFAIAGTYPEIGNADLDLLHHLQIGWQREWAREFSEYRVKRGEPALDEHEGDWPIRERSS